MESIDSYIKYERMKGKPPVASARFRQVSRITPEHAKQLVAKMLTKVMLKCVYSRARSEFDFDQEQVVLTVEPRASESTQMLRPETRIEEDFDSKESNNKSRTRGRQCQN